VSRIPRLLPLIAVAIIGVLAVNFLAGARSFPQMIGAARAFAEGSLPKAKSKKADAKAEADAKSDAALVDKAASPLPSEGGAPAITAASLAANADTLCSPAEMKYLSDLQARRGQLDMREGDIDTQLKLIEAAEAKLNAKITELGGLKADINGLLGQVDAKQASETARLVKVFTAMKPQNAAAALAVMDDNVRLPIAAGMKEAILGAIMTKMTAPQAKELTEKLAQRFASAAAVTQARAAAAPGAPAQAAVPAPANQAAAPAKPGAQPATPAAAAKPGAQAAASDAKPEAKPAARKPKRQAARTPPKAPAAAAAAADKPASPADAAATPPTTG
jgi:flagellar motility protein MotE (MotC chaperone)